MSAKLLTRQRSLIARWRRWLIPRDVRSLSICVRGHTARVCLYRLEPKEFATLREWVTEVEAFWSGQLAGFNAHAEQSWRSIADHV